MEKYKVKSNDNVNKTNIIHQSSNKKLDNNKNKDSKNKDSGKKHEEKSNNKNKEILNKKRNREEDKKENKKKEIKKRVQKKQYISDEESESDSEDKSYSAESENESSSENYSDSSEHSGKKIKSKSKSKIIKKKVNKEKKDSTNKSNKKVILKTKGSLINDLLERWWYALPSWPPENYDTSEKLKENKLRLIKIIDWKKEPKLDKNNFEKCFEMPGFKYVYMNNDGKVFDFRPEEGKPSYNNFKKLTDEKLNEYLVKALKAQLEELEKRASVLEKELRKNIKEKLDKAERNLSKYKNK